MDSCECLIAPSEVVHGAIASSFVQTLFVNHFLNGRSINVAFKNALKLKGDVFELWNKGNPKNKTK